MKNFQLAQATEWRPEVAHGESMGFNPKIKQAPAGAKEEMREFFFCRPFRGFIRFVVLPTVSPWATFCRASGALAAMVLFFAVGATAQTNGLSDAEIQGHQLAQQVCNSRPENNFAQNGKLIVREAGGKSTITPVNFDAVVYTAYWISKYQATYTNGTYEELVITHSKNAPNKYFHQTGTSAGKETGNEWSRAYLSGIEVSFSHSDFSVADLCLEFFHWPAQKVLPKTTNLKRGREYTLLESTNPNPTPNGYSRVLSWIDKESGGILFAEAYDANGKLLKEFEPKSFKKVNGQWELQEMEIRNVQTGSRTRLEFDLKSN
jgi:hypothetical protein